jgi:peroxin-2
VYEKNQSYGDSLQNLRFRDEFTSQTSYNPPSSSRKLFHAFLTICVPYFWERLNRTSINDGWGSMQETSWQKRTWRFINRFEFYFKALSAINFMLFLFQGKYRNLADRVLAMRLVYASQYMDRSVSFDFMNRELVWNSFAEMLLFLLPLINFDRVKRWFSGYGTRNLVDPYNKTPFDCPICTHSISVPYVTDCGHYYDYWCVHSMLWQEGSFPCYKCGKNVSQVKRVGL